MINKKVKFLQENQSYFDAVDKMVDAGIAYRHERDLVKKEVLLKIYEKRKLKTKRLGKKLDKYSNPELIPYE